MFGLANIYNGWLPSNYCSLLTSNMKNLILQEIKQLKQKQLK